MNTQFLTTVSPVDQFLDRSLEFDQHKADFVKPAQVCQFDETSRLTMPADMFGLAASAIPLLPTDWAWRQIFAKLGSTVFGSGTNKVLPFDYLLALKPELRAYVLNEHLGRASGEWMIRAYGDTCRAVLSSQYAPIGNSEVLDILRAISTSTSQPYSLTRSSEVTPDSLNVRIIWKNVTTPQDRGGNSDWGIGTYIGNGETGNRKLRVLPLIQRGSCQNSIIVNKELGGIELMHRGSVSTKRVLMKSTLMEVLPFAAELLERMIEADDQEIPDFADVLKGLTKQYGWSDETATNVAMGTEGKDTRAGLVNGVTFAAHSIADPDERTDLEMLGGALLMASDSLFYRAAFTGRNL